MDTSDLTPMIEDLKDSVDELEEVLAPLLKTNLSDITSKLPLLDRAKLHVLVTYGIESMIFAYLKLNGVDAREHPVFRELARVKQYYEKIKETENGGPEKRENLRLDKDAAGRFIKRALAGNDEYDKKRAEQQAKERDNAKRKFEEMSAQVGTSQRFKHLSNKRTADDSIIPSQPDSASVPSSTSSPTSPMNVGGLNAPESGQSQPAKLKRKTKKHVREKRKADIFDGLDSAEPAAEAAQNLEQTQTSATKQKHKHHSKREHNNGKSHKTPKSSSAVFQELLNKTPRAKNQQASDKG